jgi:hypothetical protein
MIDKLAKIFVGANALVWIAFGPAFAALELGAALLYRVQPSAEM